VLGDLLRYTISPILGRLMAPMVCRKLFAPAPVSTRFENEFPLELAVRPSQINGNALLQARVDGAEVMLQQDERRGDRGIGLQFEHPVAVRML